MKLDRFDVDRLAGDLRVTGIQGREVPEAQHTVAHAPGGEVHHRVADVAEFHVQHGHEVAVVVMELT